MYTISKTMGEITKNIFNISPGEIIRFKVDKRYTEGSYIQKRVGPTTTEIRGNRDDLLISLLVE